MLALEMAEKDLERKLPPGGFFWAGIKTVEFDNGDKLRVAEHAYKYSLVDVENRKKRRHVVTASVVVINKDAKKRIFEIQYNYRERHPQEIQLQPTFIYGFPSEEYLLERDPFEPYRKNERIMQALRQRRPFVGMNEEIVYLVLGQPQSISSKKGARGEEKRLLYPSQTIVIKEGKVVLREYH